jgi:hypothetical protein
MLQTLQSLVAVVKIPGWTLLGCVTAYIYSEQRETNRSKSFLRGLFPKRTEAFYFRLDFLLSASIGTALGIILYSPHNSYQALAAGIGWTAAFSLLLTQRPAANSQEQSPAVDSNASHSGPGD